MKVLVVTKNYGDGFTGATSATYALIEQWKNMNIEIIVYTLNIVGKTNDEIKIYKFNHLKELITSLKKIVPKKEKIMGYSDDHLGFLFRIASMKYIHTYHGNWPDAMFNAGFGGLIRGIWFIPLYGLTIALSQKTINVSKYMLRFTKKFNHNCIVIRNGIGLGKSNVVKRRYLLQKSTLKVVMVGGIDQRKYGYLPKVLHAINPSLSPKIQIYIYGSIHDQELGNVLKTYTNIKIMGFVDEVPYKDYDILLTTSKSENLSVAVVEALASGIPVFGFEVGGLPEIVINGELGELVPLKSYLNLVKTLETLATTGKILNFDNSKIISDFSWKKAAESYSTCFMEERC